MDIRDFRAQRNDLFFYFFTFLLFYYLLHFNAAATLDPNPQASPPCESRRIHGCIFVFCRALASADDRSRVAHAPSRRRRLPGNEAHTGFFTFALIHSEARSSAFPRFADQHDGVRVRIGIEHLYRI